MKKCWMLMLVLCLFSACAFAEEAEVPAPATLTAVGMAEPRVRDDYGTLSFNLEASGETITEAQTAMDSMLKLLRTTLHERDIEDEAISGAHYDVSGVYEYNYTKYGDQRTLMGYKVETVMQVHVSEPKNAVVIIAAVDEAGVNCSYDLIFETREDPAAYDAALAAAAQEALRKAQVLASASGLTLDRLIRLEETGTSDLAVVSVTYTVK